jgi:hypothetical protein
MCSCPLFVCFLCEEIFCKCADERYGAIDARRATEEVLHLLQRSPHSAVMGAFSEEPEVLVEASKFARAIAAAECAFLYK